MAPTPWTVSVTWLRTWPALCRVSAIVIAPGMNAASRQRGCHAIERFRDARLPAASIDQHQLVAAYERVSAGRLVKPCTRRFRGNAEDAAASALTSRQIAIHAAVECALAIFMVVPLRASRIEIYAALNWQTTRAMAADDALNLTVIQMGGTGRPLGSRPLRRMCSSSRPCSSCTSCRIAA